MLTRAEAAAHEARDGRWPEAPAEVVLLKCRLFAVYDELPTGRVGHMKMVPHEMQPNMHLAHGSTIVGWVVLACQSMRVDI